MDRRLAAVATASFRDVARLLLNDIFQCVDLLHLLILRRVSSTWKTAITNESAPFVRNVAIAVNTRGRKVHRTAYWKLATTTTSVLFFRNSNHNPSYGDSLFVGNVWNGYEEQVATDGRTVKVNKVTYARMNLAPTVLCYPLTVRQPGFQLVLYKTRVGLTLPRLCSDDYEDFFGFDPRWWTCTGIGELRVKGRDSFVFSTMDHVPVDGKYWNPVVEYFALRHVVGLTFEEKNRLTDDVMMSRMNVFLTKLEEFSMMLLERLDPNNKVAKEKYSTGDLRGFIVDAHPLVSLLVLHFAGLLVKGFALA